MQHQALQLDGGVGWHTGSRGRKDCQSGTQTHNDFTAHRHARIFCSKGMAMYGHTGSRQPG